jgi:bifunctional enzyme CysN/CysC
VELSASAALVSYIIAMLHFADDLMQQAGSDHFVSAKLRRDVLKQGVAVGLRYGFGGLHQAIKFVIWESQPQLVQGCHGRESFLAGRREPHREARSLPQLYGSTVDKPLRLCDRLPIDLQSDLLSGSLRMPVQWVCRPNADFRGYAGTVVSGRLRLGDHVHVTPAGRETRVARLLDAGRDCDVVEAGAAAMVVLADEIDVSRGDVLCAPEAPPEVADQSASHLLWFSEAPMIPERSYLLKIGTRTSPAVITALKYAVDANTGAHAAAKILALNELGFCNFAVPTPIPLDAFEQDRATGSFILIDRFTNATVGAGTVAYGLRRAQNIHPQKLEVDQRQRQALKTHAAGVLWFTGFSGAGKWTIASAVERRLNRLGCHTYLIDGDNIRGRLNRDLGFTEADRMENVRRVAEVARLFVDARLIVLVSLISPYRSDRLMARESVAGCEFVEIFVDTPLDICRQRDSKGLYAKAERGELVNFTGVDAPYEVPEGPELRLTTVNSTPNGLAGEVLEYLRRAGVISC